MNPQETLTPPVEHAPERRADAPATDVDQAQRPRRIPRTAPVVPTPPATRQLAPAVFTAILVLSDAIALAGALVFTFWARFHSGLFPSPLGIPPFGGYAAALAIVVPLGIGVLRRAGLYKPHRRAVLPRDLGEGARATGLLCVLLVALAFFYRGFSFSRTFVVGFWLISTISLVGCRRLAAHAHRELHRRGFGVQGVVIAGGGELGRRLEELIRSRPGDGLRVEAILGAREWGDLAEEDAGARSRNERLRGLLGRGGVARLIVTDPELSYDERLDLVELCHESGVRCEFVPDVFEVLRGRVRVEEFEGIPLVGIRVHPLDRVDRFKKRTLDIVVSVLGLLVAAPLFGLVALAVKLDSRGPVFYRQRRVGRDGREFSILKFRSMPVGVEDATGPVRARPDDARPTRLGRILRRTSLDELPQIWNVLKGEMSLVGPRPERQFFVDQYRQSVPRYLERHAVKCGVTGWAQVNGLRGNTSIAERTRYDIWYLQNWSLGLDLRILVLTLVRFLFQKEAY